MRTIKVQAEFFEYDSPGELTGEEQSLIEEAKKSSGNAYAPYSKFMVGAAVQLANGKIITGNNQENASYPLGLCAERVALFAAGANYPGVPIVAIAVAAKAEAFEINEPVAPCGACRQAIAEYEHRYSKPVKILLFGEKGKITVSNGIGNLLPMQFNADNLKPKK